MSWSLNIIYVLFNKILIYKYILFDNIKDEN